MNNQALVVEARAVEFGAQLELVQWPAGMERSSNVWVNPTAHSAVLGGPQPEVSVGGRETLGDPVILAVHRCLGRNRPNSSSHIPAVVLGRRVYGAEGSRAEG
jgi:hypothetical protein